MANVPQGGRSVSWTWLVSALFTIVIAMGTGFAANLNSRVADQESAAKRHSERIATLEEALRGVREDTAETRSLVRELYRSHVAASKAADAVKVN